MRGATSFALLSLILLPLALVPSPAVEANHAYLARYTSYNGCWTFNAMWQTGLGDAQVWDVRFQSTCYTPMAIKCTGFGSLEVGITGLCTQGSLSTCPTGHHHQVGIGYHRDDNVCITWEGFTLPAYVETYD